MLQLGSLLDLLDQPANRFVAEFIGNLPINLLPATVSGDGATLRVGTAILSLSPEQSGRLRSQWTGAGLTFGIRPDDVSVATEDDGATLEGRVRVLEPQGDRTVVIAETPAGHMSALLASHSIPRAGASLRFRFNMARAHVFTEASTNLLAGTAQSRGR